MKTTTQQQLPILPDGIEKIALSFSGGGFRAAGFTLGCVSYLDHVPYKNEKLLHKVRFISSASGGSLTNILLCSMLRQGKSFKEIYDHQVNQMTGCNLLDQVFDLLNNDAAWADRPEKSRNLINTFAMAYDLYLFKGATFKTLHETPEKEGFVIAETCVNTTEFDNGMNFRWETNGVIGNKFLYFQPKRLAADKIKLGDILASSSCFSAGFEPIMFPADFTWKAGSDDLTIAELSRDIVEKNNYNNKETTASANNEPVTFGFMDGGIDDNQGIYAFELADHREKGHYDLYFPCDVSSNFLDSPFTYPAINLNPVLKQNLPQLLGKIKKGVARYFMITALAFLVALGLLFIKPAAAVGLVLSGLFFAAIALPVLAAYFVKKKAGAFLAAVFPGGGNSGSWGVIFNKYKSRLLQIPLNRLLAMLLARFSSVLLLAMTIYLKRIRQISYQLLYADKANDTYTELVSANNEKPGLIDAGVLWKNHIGVTTVYQLSAKNDFMLRQILANPVFAGQHVSATDKREVLSVLYPIGKKLQDVADIAANIATTLWFDDSEVKNKSLESLIATGQATICFNLILMAFQFGNTDEGWLALKAELVTDWEKFKNDPYWLI